MPEAPPEGPSGGALSEAHVFTRFSFTITGDHSKEDHILRVKIATCIGFFVYRRSYLMWSSVIELKKDAHFESCV